MKRLINVMLVVALLVSVIVSGGCAKRKVTVKTGEIVLCTAGEVVEDNTKEVEVPVDEVAGYSVTTRLVTCDTHGGLASLYDAAQKAIAAGDLDAARAKLETVLAKNPAYKNASAQLDDIKNGRTPTPDQGGGSTDTSTTPEPGGEVSGPVASLLKYVPDVIDGYSAQEITVDPTLLTRNYVPSSGKADLLVISAEQVVDAKMATEAIASLKTAYPGSGSTVDLGSVKGYFGTMNEFALVAFAQGPVVVSVEMHVAKGKAADLKSAIVSVAKLIAK